MIIQSTRPASCLDHSFSLRRSSTPSSVRVFNFTILLDYRDSSELIVVFVIRYVERRIDRLLDPAILDHSPLPSEFDGIQFESEWSFFRSLTSKKKPTLNHTVVQSAKNGIISSPSLPSRPTSPILPSPPPGHLGFATLKHSLSRSRGAPLQSIFNDAQPQETSQDPTSITLVFDALQTFLILSGTNPALITQLWAQVYYWIACEFSPTPSITYLKARCVGEVFNRMLSRKKYLCRCVRHRHFRRFSVDIMSRSRAIRIGMNLCALEEWGETANLPRGVLSQLAPARDLLNWLQVRCSVRPRCGHT